MDFEGCHCTHHWTLLLLHWNLPEQLVQKHCWFLCGVVGLYEDAPLTITITFTFICDLTETSVRTRILLKMMDSSSAIIIGIVCGMIFATLWQWIMGCPIASFLLRGSHVNVSCFCLCTLARVRLLSELCNSCQKLPSSIKRQEGS